MLFGQFNIQGCASIQEINISLPEEIPQTWLTPLPQQENITGPWWKSFSDTTFQKYFEIFQNNNPDLRSIFAQLEIAKQTAKINGAVILPNVSGTNSNSNRKQNLSAFGLSGGMLGLGGNSPNTSTSSSSSNSEVSFDSQNYGINLGVQWEIDIWGKLLNQRRSALKEYEATQNELGYLLFSLSAQFTNAYYNAVEAAIQNQLAIETSSTLADIRNIVQDRYNNGLSSSLDLRIAESSFAMSIVQKENRSIQYKNSLRVLEMLMGKYPAGSLMIPSTFPIHFPNIPAGIPSELINRRPDIQSALLKADASSYRMAQAKRNLLPSITLTASGGTSTSDIQNILNGDYSVWNIGTNLTAPIFQGGRLRANVSLAKNELTLAEQNVIKTIITAFSEVEQSLTADASVQRQFIAIKDAEQQAASAYILAFDRYEKGLTDLVTVMNSQQQWFSARSSKITIQSQQINARINLLLALGGEFTYKNN